MVKKDYRKFILGGILVILIVASLGIKNLTGNIAESGSNQEDWLIDNCECVERDNWYCPAGFELHKEEKRCVAEDSSFTNVRLGCSKYKCGYEIWRIK